MFGKSEALHGHCDADSAVRFYLAPKDRIGRLISWRARAFSLTRDRPVSPSLALLDPRTAHVTSRGPQLTRCVGLFPAVPADDRDCHFTLSSFPLTVFAMSFVDDAAFSREDLYHLQHHRDVNRDGREGLSSTFGPPPPFVLGGTQRASRLDPLALPLCHLAAASLFTLSLTTVLEIIDLTPAESWGHCAGASLLRCGGVRVWSL